MMDMTIADAEMLLDLLGRQGEHIHHTVAESRRKLVRKAHEVLDVALLLRVPAGVFELVRHPLHKKRCVMPPLIVLQGRIGWRMHVPLYRWEVGKLTGLHFLKPFANM